MTENNCFVTSGRDLDLFRDSLKRDIAELYPDIALTRNLNCFIKYVDIFATTNPSLYLQSNIFQTKIEIAVGKMLKTIIDHYNSQLKVVIPKTNRSTTRLVVWRSSVKQHNNINIQNIMNREIQIRIEKIIEFKSFILRYIESKNYKNKNLVIQRLFTNIIQSIQEETQNAITQFQDTNPITLYLQKQID